MSPPLRRLQWIGLLLFAISACTPAFPYRSASPAELGRVDTDEPIVVIGPTGEATVPFSDLATAISAWAVEGQSAEDTLWPARPIYFYALLPIWVFALLLARRSRRAAGALMWSVTGLVILLEARYLGSDYLGFLPGRGARIETVIVWCFVVLVLVYRRPADRGLEAVEASVAAQAMLGLLHGITLPSTFARELVGYLPWEEVLARTWAIFGLGFWIGMVGLVLTAIPGYLGRRAGVPAPTPTPAAARVPVEA